MDLLSRVSHAWVWPLVLTTVAAAKTDYFVFDPADETVEATVLDNTEYYDVHVTTSVNRWWMTWLEFIPGKGDVIWAGCRNDREWLWKKRLMSDPGRFAHPQLAADTNGGAWLTFEAEMDGQWDLFMVRLSADGDASPVKKLSSGPGPDTCHQTAVDSKGGLWVVWQSDQGGQFDVLAGRVSTEGTVEPFVVSESSPQGDWDPDVAVTPDGTVWVVWDSYDGNSHNVHARFCRNGSWERIVKVADGTAFEGRPQVVADGNGRIWVVWEQGGENWGKRFVLGMHKPRKGDMRISDTCGPLHRFRQLRLALLDSSGNVRWLKDQLPMPSIRQATQRAGAPDNIKRMGAFYEGGRLAVDHRGRVWLMYRHFYAPTIGLKGYKSHQQADWGVYARCLQSDGWSKLYRFDIGQGDGMQSLAIAPTDDGVVAAWTTGRTDRRKVTPPRGVALATVSHPEGKPPGEVETVASRTMETPAVSGGPKKPIPEPAAVGGKTYELFFGDLHRHTDLSLCRVPTDGTIVDAYRYAIDVAKLDFLGITDHARDIAMGNPLSQLWWRSTKEVIRHELKPVFLPMFAYERSRAGEDHNVISLRADMLRTHEYPHSDFWKELDNDTLTIPHQTYTPEIPKDGPEPYGLTLKTWNVRDDVHRPLFEIYQAARDRSIERDAHEGLARGHIFGFIASSDHQATGSSFACVWAERRDRETIFRAMQARRTYGATDKIRLVVTADDHWMGQRFAAAAMPKIRIEAQGTAPVETVEILIDGEVVRTLPQATREIRLTYTPAATEPGQHYLYVHLMQSDGNEAWSSPMWVDVRPKK